MLAIVSVLGFFTRITFLAFVIAPYIYFSVRCFKKNVNNPKDIFLHLCIFVSVSFATVLACILEDYKFYGVFVITFWNNLKYNSQIENLSQHGLHSRLTHFFTNMPLLCGPLIFVPKLWDVRKPATWLWLLPVFILSLFPHQEPRFLLPAASIFIVNSGCLVRSYWIKFLFVMYAVVLAVFFGIMHQNGVIPAVLEVKNIIEQRNVTTMENCNLYFNPEMPTTIYFWKIYSAPTWMLARPKFSQINTSHLYNYSTKQMISKFWETYYEEVKVVNLPEENTTEFQASTLLVCPVAMLQTSSYLQNLTMLHYIPYHVDLDDTDELPLAELIMNHGIGIFTAKEICENNTITNELPTVLRSVG